MFAAADTQTVAHAMVRFKNEILQDLQLGRTEGAARKFINYWSGLGAWEKLNEQQQAAMSAKMATVIENFETLFAA